MLLHPQTRCSRPRIRSRQRAPRAATRTAAGAVGDYRRELNAGHAVQPGTSLLLAKLVPPGVSGRRSLARAGWWGCFAVVAAVAGVLAGGRSGCSSRRIEQLQPTQEAG